MKQFDAANLEVEIAYANGEAVITGSYFGVPIHQEIPCQSPCTIIFDPETLNFEAINLPKHAAGKNIAFNVEEF